jgi:hypothetical protein
MAGVGVSMAIPCIAATGMNAVALEVLGTAVGILNTVQQLSAFFGIAIGTAAFHARGSLSNAATIAAGFRPANFVAACFAALAALLR